MKRAPNSKSNLERSISRYTNNNAVRANELAVALANAIVAQMIGAGVVKGGTSLKLRYGDKATRVQPVSFVRDAILYPRRPRLAAW